jgi:hypothetical protein
VAACACCTNQGQRRVGVERLDSGKREEIDRLRFSADAQLFSGEGDPADTKGIAKSSGRYALRVSQEPNRWVFDFRDKAGGSGTLTLAIPATVSIFEVDPRRGERPGGQGPTLYKEWTLTSAAAGTGIFARGWAAASAPRSSCRATATVAPAPAISRIGRSSSPGRRHNTPCSETCSSSSRCMLGLVAVAGRATDHAISLFIYRRSLT